MKIGDYILTNKLAVNTFGNIYLTTKINSDVLYATKKISKELYKQKETYECIQNEISIMKRLNHRNIISLKDLIETNNHYYVIMEYCNGDTLSSCLEKYKKLYHKGFSEETVQHIMRQIANAIKYIHDLKIVHRDLKPDNIFVKFENENDKNNLNLLKAQIKVSDFSFAAYKKDNQLLHLIVGSPLYMDPLILKILSQKSLVKEKIGYDEKVDIWSLGVLCYEMTLGNLPFDTLNLEDLNSKIEEGSYKLPTYLSSELVSFINCMLQYYPTKRLSANELINHPFLIKNTKDFNRIDLNKVSKMVFGGQLKINIKDNNWVNQLNINMQNQKSTINNQKNNMFAYQIYNKNNRNIPSQYNNIYSNSMNNNIGNQTNKNMNSQRINLLPGEKLMSVIIWSNNQEVHTSVICKNTDLFVNVELKVYEQYPKYKETENFFTVNGIKVNKYKTLDENKIKDNAIILLNTIE